MKTKALVLLASSSLIASAAFADNNWKLSAGLNYQEFGNNGTQYATQDSNKEFNVDTDYHTGYFLDWMYHLEEKDSDVGFDYNHLRASDSSSLTGNNIQIQPGGLGTATWASGMTTFTYDSFDLKAGHTVKLSPSFSLGYYGGLNYTRLEKELVSDVLVYRYKNEENLPDKLKGREGTFTICSFWYVECLAKGGESEKAAMYFGKLLGYANHLGLYSEQIALNGQHLGNFPQAFTHLSLISAAIELTKKEHLRKKVLPPDGAPKMM